MLKYPKFIKFTVQTSTVEFLVEMKNAVLQVGGGSRLISWKEPDDLDIVNIKLELCLTALYFQAFRELN